MRIVLFGASGGLGSEVLGEAASRGHHVSAFVRNPASIANPPDGVSLIAGDLRDPAAVAAAVDGHDAVISCIGARDDHLDVLSMGMAHIIAGMQAAGVRRVIAVGGAGILQHDDLRLRRDMPGFPAMLQAVSAEHLKVFGLLRSSDLSWTLVCPPWMPPEPGRGMYRAERDYMPEEGSQIAYADVALFILDELEGGGFVGARVGVAY